MLRKLIILSTCVAILLGLTNFKASASAEFSQNSAYVLYEPSEGVVLKGANEGKRLPMASTTKIMTAILAIENLDLGATLVASKDCTGIEGSSLYIKEGDKIKASDLIYGLMLCSANDAAVMLAISISESVNAFSDLMNEKAKELGLEDTHFTNPHGLDDKEHYTTAKDLAVLSTYALENPIFEGIAATVKKNIAVSDNIRLAINHNKLLKSYDGCIGIKTGYTKRSGRCLVSCAERDNVKLICVTLNYHDDWSFHSKMLDEGFSLCEFFPIPHGYKDQIEIPVLNGKADYVLASPINLPEGFVGAKDDNFEFSITIDKYLVAPVKKNHKVGVLTVKKNNKEFYSTDIVTEYSVNKTKQGLFKQ